MKKNIFILLLLLCNMNVYSQIDEEEMARLKSVYDYVAKEDFFYLVSKNGKKGVLDLNGNLIIPCDYESIYNDGFGRGWLVTKNGQTGALSLECKEIVPCRYDFVFIDITKYPDLPYVMVKRNGCEGLYDCEKKKEVVPLLYEYCGYRWNGLADIEKNGKNGLYDIKKKCEIVPTKYDWVGDSYYTKNDNKCLIKKEDKLGLYDCRKQREVIPCLYNKLYLDDNGEGAVAMLGGTIADGIIKINGKWGHLSLSNSYSDIPFEYEYLEAIGEDLFKYNVGGNGMEKDEPVGGLWGVIDSNNKIVFKPEYTEIRQFKDGVAQVVKDGVASVIVNPYSGTKLKLVNDVSTCMVDKNIPTIERVNDETFAFVFANENYKSCSGADFAINDGKVFAKYCHQTLGIPESNVKYYEDATFGNVQSALKKMQDVADVYDGDAKIIFYFSGLGLTENNQRYILPSDASLSSVASTGVSVEKILSVLNGLNTKYTLALFDAPFNGTDKLGKMLEAARGVKIRSKAPTSSGKTIAVFGSSDDKNNYCDEKNGHGLLTYNILQQLQQSKGQYGVKMLIENAIKDVEESSLKDFKEVQSPQIVISETVKENWQTIKF